LVDTYLDTIKTTRPLADGETQTHEGGIAFASDDWARLRRFLILGSESGSYYVGKADLTADNAAVVRRCLDADAVRTLIEIRTVSEEGRAPKNEPAIFALALAAAHPEKLTRMKAFAGMPTVCRTGTHFLHFVSYLQQLRKWSRMYRTAAGEWFNRPDLAYQAIKYQNRDGWSLADVLRLAHPKPTNDEQSAIFKWIVDGETGEHTPGLLTTVKLLQSGNVQSVSDTIREFRIPREAVPTALLNDPKVWDALLQDMPITAMIRNLAKMTAVGLLTETSAATMLVLGTLAEQDRLKKARVHPLNILAALKVYEQGHGERGSLTWTPVKRIVNALDEAFYLAFGAVPSTGKRIRLALDVSGSMMGSKIAGMPFIDCRMAAAAMALVTKNVEPNADILAYSHTLVPLEIRPSMRLDEVLRIMDRIPAGGTYCSLPVIDALAERTEWDAFVSYTDSETWDGGIRAQYAFAGVPTGSFTDYLRQYRATLNPTARSAVVGMVANEFTLNDPADPLGMDVVGMDTAVPAVLADFIGGGF
jgi:60 kDa SS-A/Ro ribonucleoprotein